MKGEPSPAWLRIGKRTKKKTLRNGQSRSWRFSFHKYFTTFFYLFLFFQLLLFCHFFYTFFTHDIYPHSRPTTSTHYPRPTTFRGCLHDTGATFAPRRVHFGSLSWLYICLHDTTTKSHAGASRPGVSSLRLSHRGENFTPVRNLATVSCKHETTTRFGVKSV